MKKEISLIMSICMVVGMIPFTAYASNITPEISLEEFTDQLQELQTEYDNGNMFREITIEDGKELCHIDGEEYPVSEEFDKTATVTENDIEIPLSAIEPYCKLPETSTYSLDNEGYKDITVDKETAEELGFQVDIEDNKAVLTQPYQTERLIVKSKYDINPLDSVAIVEGYDDLHIVQFDNQESAKQAEEYYNKQALIEYAEADFTVSTMDIESIDTENTTASSFNGMYAGHLSWGSEAIGIDDYIDYLIDSDYPEIIVAVIDTGIDLDHEFLKNRIIETNYNNSSSGDINSEDDDQGHGTHVAGIVADNTTDNVKIKGYKILSSEGKGSVSNIILGIEKAIEDNVDVINMSLGGKGSSKELKEVVNKAYKNNITICVSSGNSASNAVQYEPANIECCITVGANDIRNTIPYWSNWGECVDIIAPGVSINSSYNDGDYKSMSGTSMASPFVAAASAMLLTNNTDLMPEEIITLLEEYAKKCEDESSLYLGSMIIKDRERTLTPTISVGSGNYSNSIIVELNCGEDADIYYTTDGSRATENSLLYTEPIVIDKITNLHVMAHAKGKIKSLQNTAQYYITTTDVAEKYVIDTDGTLLSYNGNNKYLTIPDEINGIKVLRIGSHAFASRSLVMITLPDSCTEIGSYAFRDCRDLTTVFANNIKIAREWAFGSCTELSNIDLTQLEEVEKRAFNDTHSITELNNKKLKSIPDYAFTFMRGLIMINLPNVTSIGKGGLWNATYVEELNLPNVEYIDSQGLSGYQCLKELYLPKLKQISGKNVFHALSNAEKIILPNLEGTISDKVFSGNNADIIYLPKVENISENAFGSIISNAKILFIPNASFISSLPLANETSVYVGKNVKSIIVNNNISYNIIAPSNSYAQQWANENGHKFIPSDYRDESIAAPTNVTDLGRSICCSAAGVRFGFTWDNIDEIESLAANIEYGFIYSQKGAENLSIDTVDNKNIKKTVANNRVDHGGTTSFNLVIANIPKSYYDREITARAYVCIDGMYFYSNILKGSFSEVAQLVLADNEIDTNTKNAINNLLSKEV